MNSYDIIKQISEMDNGIILSGVAEKNGVSRSTLYSLCKQGRLTRIAKGQYILPDEIGDEMLSLSHRSGFIVFSHESALFLNGLSERTPFEHTVSVPKSQRISPSTMALCKLYYVKDELFELGKITLNTTMGNPVPTYDMERTICDIIRSRSRISDETFIAAIKLYTTSTKKNLPKLGKYSEAFGIMAKVRSYMEVLL